MEFTGPGGLSLTGALGSIRVHSAWGHTISILQMIQLSLDSFTEFIVGVEQNQRVD